MERKRASRSEVECKEVGQEGSREFEKQKESKEACWQNKILTRMETQVGMNV